VATANVGKFKRPKHAFTPYVRLYDAPTHSDHIVGFSIICARACATLLNSIPNQQLNKKKQTKLLKKQYKQAVLPPKPHQVLAGHNGSVMEAAYSSLHPS
jgi:hypothetical protein